MSLRISRKENETWREAALRYAAPYGLERAVGDAFDDYVSSGDNEDEAAWCACYDWDVLDLVDDPEPDTGRLGTPNTLS